VSLLMGADRGFVLVFSPLSADEVVGEFVLVGWLPQWHRTVAHDMTFHTFFHPFFCELAEHIYWSDFDNRVQTLGFPL
jgi:hypothetical protein